MQTKHKRNILFNKSMHYKILITKNELQSLSCIECEKFENKVHLNENKIVLINLEGIVD